MNLGILISKKLKWHVQFVVGLAAAGSAQQISPRINIRSEARVDLTLTTVLSLLLDAFILHTNYVSGSF